MTGIRDVIDYLAYVLSLIIPVLVGLAVVVFFWGIVKFVSAAGDEKAIEDGKAFMVWGMVGLFVMISLWGIIGYIQGSLGLSTAGLLFGSSLPEQANTVPTP